MFKKPTKQELILFTAMTLWIFVLIFLTGIVLPGVPNWPMCMVTVCFFLQGPDPKKIPHIFCGALVGLFSAYALVMLEPMVTAAIGPVASVAILLFAVLALIIIGGSFSPLLFNNSAFAYLTIAMIDATVIQQNLLTWLLMLLIGGPIILFGSLFVINLVQKQLAKRDPSQGTPQ